MYIALMSESKHQNLQSTILIEKIGETEYLQYNLVVDLRESRIRRLWFIIKMPTINPDALLHCKDYTKVNIFQIFLLMLSILNN